ncbi:PRKC apoptosis WT1 regulator protein [Protopterus annectens]|uniref:PRKC apoptosis WT1 regulator protein n=1 Tax=Protopterus annectens TaxID=7888 RepID=UPI001CFC44A9|nr:PRKC apoptosis WT1 regulator protein [Protopterus annectens]
MATGGFKSSGGTDFLEEWKAKREKMLRAKMNQMNNANVPNSSAGSVNPSGNGGAPVGSEVNNNANPDRGLTGPANCVSSVTSSLARPPSSSSLSVRRNEEDGEQLRPAADLGGKKTVESRNPADNESGSESVDKEGSPASGKGKDKNKSSGPSARKGKIEKRKLREKRRSTGVVSLPSAESPEEYDEDEAELKKKEHSITQQNTLQNESVVIDPSATYSVQDTNRTAASRFKSATNATEEDSIASSGRYNRTERTGYARYRDSNSAGSAVQTSALEKKIEELERELVKERQETSRLVKVLQDKDEIIGKLKDEIELLNRDLDDIEDENEQLKQENKTLLKVVGQLTR